MREGTLGQLRIQQFSRGLGVGAAIFCWFCLSACSRLKDCGEDSAKCAELLNKNAIRCAETFQLKPTDGRRKVCAHAIEFVGDEKNVDAVPGLAEIVLVPESTVGRDTHRSEAAKALGKIGAKAAVAALIKALDFSNETGQELNAVAINRSNEEIAEALGSIGDRRAIGPLLELLEKTRDNNVALWAMRALGQLEAVEAVPLLGRVALSHENKFMRRNAVIALGTISDPSAIDTLIKMMFVEYQGVSFYKEASYALFQIGPEAVDPLLHTLALNNRAVNAIFKKSGGDSITAIRSKCGVVLGDLRDKKSLEPLVAHYRSAVDAANTIVVRELALALGALDDSRAVPALMTNMKTIDGALRERVMEALNRIGDRRPVPAMIEASTARDFLRQCVASGATRAACTTSRQVQVRAQQVAAEMAVRLADSTHVELVERTFSQEKDAKLQTEFRNLLRVAKLSTECQEDASCWARHAESDDPAFREKAYWELGRLGGEEAQKQLAKGLSDKNRRARAAAIYSYWKVGDSSVVGLLEKQLDKEVGAIDFIVVNEDLKRLYVDLKRRQRASSAE